MPVARIISQSTSDAARLVAHLQALGYTLEVVPPDASGLESHADLEIRLDQCDRAEALAEAERRARELGADIYVASGALQLTETVHDIVEPEPGIEDLLAPNQAIASPDTEPPDAEPMALRDPLAPPVLIAIPSIPELAESFPSHAAEASPFGPAEFDELEPVGDSAQGNAPIAAGAAPAESDTFGGFTLFGGAESAEETPSPSAD